MIDALIQGKLLKDPEARQTKAGKPYATARVRVPTTNPAETIFVSVVAFDPEAVAALLALVDYVLGDNNPARYTTDQLDLLDPDEFAMLAGGHSTGTEWLRLAASDPPDDWDEWSDNDDC